MKKFLFPLTVFLCILVAIVLADIGSKNFIFKFIKSIPHGDKFFHLLLYGILAFSLNFALNFRTIYLIRYNIQLGAIIVFLFAFLEEMSQYFIPYRSFDLYDLLADVVGVIVFSMIRFK